METIFDHNVTSEEVDRKNDITNTAILVVA